MTRSPQNSESVSADDAVPSSIGPFGGLSKGVKASLLVQLAGLGLLFLPWGPLWLALWILGNHGVLAIAGTIPRSRLLGPNQTRLPTEHAAQGRIGLSFDDGPDPEVTPQVLDILAGYGVRATFFLIGARAGAHPDLVRRIHDEGHCIQNHTQSHSSWFCTYSPGRLVRELQSAQQALIEAGAPRPDQFRAPAGVRSPWLEPVLRRLGLRLVSWTHRGFDTSQADPQRVFGRLTRDLGPGSILLLHDGNTARDAHGQPVVLTVLPQLLDEVERRGLKPCPVLPTNAVN